MEITLGHYSNFMSGWKETAFNVSRDDLVLHPINSSENTQYHLSQGLLGFYNKDDSNRIGFIIPKKNKEIIYLLPAGSDTDEDNDSHGRSNQMKDFYFSMNYFNGCSYTFDSNLRCWEFGKKEKYALNTKEIYGNLKLYTLDTYYKEGAGNVKNNRGIAKSIMDALKKKGDHVKIKEVFIGNDNTDIVSDCDNMVDGIFLNSKYVGDALAEKGTEDEITASHNNNNNSNDNCINITSDTGGKIRKYNGNEIDKIREHNTSLIRILIELRRTINERYLTFAYLPNISYKDIYEEISSRYNKLDIYTRLLFAKYGNQEQSHIQASRNSLASKYESCNKKHCELLKRLRLFIESSDYQIYPCFKCSNIGTYSMKATASSCGYDKKCTQKSHFHCKRCNVSFCTYCIYFPRRLLCISGHPLIPRFISNDLNTESEICWKCQTSIQSERYLYHCSKCNNTNLCPSCHDKYVDLNKHDTYKCVCGKDIYWKRGYYRVCNVCKVKRKCHWFCLFCQVNYCVFCKPTNPMMCGGEHEMEVVNGNIHLIHKTGCDRYPGNNKYVNKKLIDIINGFNFGHNAACDACDKNKCCFKYTICYRCNYIKCDECSKCKPRITK